MKQLAIVALMLLMPLVAFAGYNDTRYDISVYDQTAEGRLGDRLITNVMAFVYTAGTKTLATLYSNKKRTSLANPITRTQFATDDKLKFYAAASSVDVVLAHSDGSIAKYASVSSSIHRLKLDRSGTKKVLIVPFAASTAETDTGVDLPYGVLVKDVVVEVVTGDATETMDVGLLSTETAGDADGFMNDVVMSPAAFYKGLTTTVGSNETYVSTAYYGALLGPVAVGTDANTDTGAGVVPGHIVSGSNAVSVTYTGSAGTDTAAGYIYVFFEHLR